MVNNNDNQPKAKTVFHLYEMQPELIAALSTINKVFEKLAYDKQLAYLIYYELGDDTITALKHLCRVAQYLEIIINNNKALMNEECDSNKYPNN